MAAGGGGVRVPSGVMRAIARRFDFSRWEMAKDTELSDGLRMDYWARHPRAAISAGAFQSFGVCEITPLDEVMAREEGRGCARNPEGSDRAEVLQRVLAYLLGGSVDPCRVGIHFFRSLRYFFPEVAEHERAAWVRTIRQMAAMPGRFALDAGDGPTWARQGFVGPVHANLADITGDDAAEVARAVIGHLHKNRHPLVSVKNSFALAMPLARWLVLDPSLAQLAEVFGETRAAVSIRIKILFNRPIEAVGGVGYAAFQKRAETVEKYREAQRGNSNRLGTGRKAATATA